VSLPATDAGAVWEEHLRSDMDAIYAGLTDGYRRQLRVSELVYAAAEQFPEQLPSRAAIDEERELLQKDKQGLEISQGIFVAHVLAHPRSGFHLMHAMSQPTAEALARLGEFERAGAIDLGPMRVDREGDVGHVTVQNHTFLNSEDDVSTAALEVAIDLVLLDDRIRVGVLRGAPAPPPK
jgi:thioesterase DpgC